MCIEIRVKSLMKLAGIDLAWQSKNNPSGVAVGTLSGDTLDVTSLEPAIVGANQQSLLLFLYFRLCHTAIDAAIRAWNTARQIKIAMSAKVVRVN